MRREIQKPNPKFRKRLISSYIHLVIIAKFGVEFTMIVEGEK